MWLAAITLAALLISGCASAPLQGTTVPVNIVGCSSNLLPPAVAGGDPRAALILLGLEVGYDVTAYGTCQVDRWLHPAPEAVVSGGVYHSAKGTFTVDLPSVPDSVKQPSINIVQPSFLPSDYAMFWLLDDGEGLKSGAIVYGAGTAGETAAQQAEPLELAAAEGLHRNSMTTDRLGGNATTLLHHEAVTLDGRPALFAVYRSALHMGGTGSQPLYLLSYFTRDQGRSATLMIFWQGDCQVCVDGKEADIRKLDPGIGRFVDSFHLDDAVIAGLSAKAGAGTPPTAPAVPTMSVPPGKAVIYFFRRSQLLGGLHFDVEENGNEVGELTADGSYFHVIADPGKHDFILTGWNLGEEPCEVQAEEGQTRYMLVQPEPAPLSLTAIFKSPTILSCHEVADLDAVAEMANLKDLSKASN